MGNERQAPADDQTQPAEGEALEDILGEDAAEAAVEPDPDQLKLLLEDARTKADENWNELLRARAEIDNLRKRHERELANAHKYGMDRLVQELLPVRDSLELGLQAANDPAADVAKLREGKQLTLNLLSAAMDKFDIEQIDPVGQPFDPERHQAMSMQESADVAPNTVVTVVQKGYLLAGRVVRPAMVIVSRPPAAPESVDTRA